MQASKGAERWLMLVRLYGRTALLEDLSKVSAATTSSHPKKDVLPVASPHIYRSSAARKKPPGKRPVDLLLDVA